MSESMFIAAATAPVSPESGQMWDNTLTGQVFVCLNDDWLPLISGGVGGVSQVFGNSLLVMIDYADKTELIEKASITVDNILTQQVDTASAILFDMDGTNKPGEGNDVAIIDVSGVPEKIFGGVLLSAPQTQISKGIYQYALDCADYSERMKHRIVLENYANQYAGDIIKDIIANYMPEFGIVNIAKGELISYIAFNYATVEKCISQLAELTNYDWYVDYDKDIHFFSSETYTAPYELTDDSATSGRYKDLEISIDISQVRNYVYIHGGYYLSLPYTQSIVADGEQSDFNLTYSPYAPVSAKVNSVTKTVGIENVNVSGFDFVVNFNEKTLRNLDFAKLSLGAVLEITYKREIRILVPRYNQVSIDQMKAIDGVGDGIREHIINDDTIQTKLAAVKRAKAELTAFAFPYVAGSFTTDQKGYKAGQQLTINIPSRQIDVTVLIQQVTTQSYGVGNFEYSIQFGSAGI